MVGFQNRVCTLLLFFMAIMITMAYGATNPNDLQILNDFRKGLQNPELLNWPESGDDPCGTPSWPYVFCNGDRVTQIQTMNLGLKGSLPQNLNQLTELQNLGLQNNNLSGVLPSFSGLSKLEYAFLNNNQFEAIPSDFFKGLTSIRILSFEENPFLNASASWSFPMDLEESVQLTNLSLVNCNLFGTLPDFLGKLPSLVNLRLSYNNFSGGIPASFGQSSIQVLWLNNQLGTEKMTGPIDVIASMTSLTQVWLHGNMFTGEIPQNIGNLVSLQELILNGNQLVGLIPESLANMTLDLLDLNNNMLMGPIPNFKAANVTYENNLFCQTEPGLECALQVTPLLDFLHDLEYPSPLSSHWSGNEPCKDPSWFGLSCNQNSELSIINLPSQNLNGTLSPSISKLTSLLEIRLGGNNISGKVPSNLTELESLRLLDLSDNNFEPPLPEFHDGVKVITDGNPLFGSTPPPSSAPLHNMTQKLGRFWF